MTSPSDNPVVSVCIQTYQHRHFIAKCLDSVLNQKTNFPFEIILGEDDSTDGTREICEEYAKKHPSIIRVFLRSRADKIYVDNLMTGRFNFIQNLQQARGRYIALVDGDDFLCDDLKLQKQFDMMEANPQVISVDIVLFACMEKSCGCIRATRNGRLYRVFSTWSFFCVEILFRCPVRCSAKRTLPIYPNGTGRFPSLTIPCTYSLQPKGISGFSRNAWWCTGSIPGVSGQLKKLRGATSFSGGCIL